MTRRIVNFLDIETTGVNLPEHRIVEHCSKLFDLDTEEHIETVILRCNPMRTIDRKAAEAHGIKLADLEHEPTFDQIAPEILRTINGSYLNVAHNGDDFDFDFLNRELNRVGLRPVFAKTFDTMKRARFATPYGKNPRLGELATCLDVPYDKALAHSAEYDVSVMAACFFEARRINWFSVN